MKFEYVKKFTQDDFALNNVVRLSVMLNIFIYAV